MTPNEAATKAATKAAQDLSATRRWKWTCFALLFPDFNDINTLQVRLSRLALDWRRYQELAEDTRYMPDWAVPADGIDVTWETFLMTWLAYMHEENE